MTTITMEKPVRRRSAPVLSCQSVGGASARVTATALSTVALLVAACLFCVWSRTEVVKNGYEVSKLAKRISALSARQEALKAEAARLRSADRIERIAKHKLGMQFPEREQIMIVELSTPGEDPGVLVAKNQPGSHARASARADRKEVQGK